MGQVVGAVDHDKDKSALVGVCPDVVGIIKACRMPFILDTGSQVMLLSQSLLRRHREGTGMTNAGNTPWLTLQAANGLEIPYVSYALVDCMVL